MRSNHAHRRHGFTLIELIVASAIASVVLVSLTSVIMLAARAVPDPDGPTGRMVVSGQILSRLADELATADRIVAHDDHSIAFTVPDRDLDGQPERIRYAWSGTDGDPLTRAYNDRGESAIIPSLDVFHLAAERSLRAESYPSTASGKQLETLLIKWDDIGTPSQTGIDSLEWLGQDLRPDLPADATAWRPTRISLRVRATAFTDNPEVTVEIRDRVSFLPGGTVHGSAIIDAREYKEEWTYVTVAFDGVPDIAAADQLSLVIRGEAAVGEAPLEFEWYQDNDFAGGLLESEDGGTTWDYSPNRSLVHYLYGVITRPTSTALVHHRFLDAMRIRIGREEHALDVRTPALNSPELLAGWWDYDRDDIADPLTYDGNGDGIADWALRGGGVIADLATVNLDSQPATPITTPTLIEYDAMAVGFGSTATLDATIDHDGTTAGRINVMVAADFSGQTVSVYFGGVIPLTEELVITGLPNSEEIPIRLIIDPDRQTVNIMVHEIDRGTLTWPREGAITIPSGVSLSWSGDGRIYDLEVRVLEAAP